jgi:hypothetical protein
MYQGDSLHLISIPKADILVNKICRNRPI